MEKRSTRVIMIGAASVFGVALVAGGAYAARGSLTVADAPGKVLQVSGVGSASALAVPTTTARTNPSAKGGSSASTAQPTSQVTAIPQSGVNHVAPPAAKMLPTRHAETRSPEPAHNSSHP